MLDFIQDKAEELGALECPHCGILDFAFGLAGNNKKISYCISCKKEVQKYSTLKTMQFSLEVFRELVANYDNLNLPVHKTNLIGTLTNFLEPILTSNTLPSNDDIFRLQQYLKFSRMMLGNTIHPKDMLVFDFGKNFLNFSKEKISRESMYTLSVCLLCLLYIVKYPAKGLLARLFAKKPVFN